MIDQQTAYEMIEIGLKAGADFAEVFAERKKSTSLSILNGKTESSNSGVSQAGVGFRLISGDRIIYACASDFDHISLIRTAKDAAAAIVGGEKSHTLDFTENNVKNAHKIEVLPFGVSKKVIFDKLKSANDAAFAHSKLISEFTASFSAYEQEIAIYNSEGLYAEDKRVRTRLTANAVASSDGEKQTGYFGPGAFAGYEFAENLDLDAVARKAAEIAATMLSASYAPSGRFPVVLEDGFGGVLFHEACGHGLEAIAVSKGSSVFAEKLGEKIGSHKLTAIDDGTIPNSWGSQNIDDEGIKTTKNILIENGVLKNYICDNFYGKKLGLKSTGSCRRQSYRYAPVPRMTNTYIAGGTDSRNDIISSVDYGIYCKNMGGGSVNTATGEFNFAVSEAYLIENGKITKPLRGASLIGRGAEIIRDIEMVAEKPRLACGMCGASSGSVPVTVGQPMLKISKMTVGGKA